MSTIDPETTRNIGAQVKAKGAEMIDSPVGKTADAAVAGNLTLMVGGPAEVIARVRPILDAMGTDFFHCGELGAGQTMKLLNNLLAQAIGSATTEALVSGVKAGLTLELMMSVLRTTMAWNQHLAIGMPKKPLVGNFTPGFMVKLAHKDARLALKMVDALGVKAPVGHATFAALDEGMKNGLQDMDVGAMLKLREEQAGVTVRMAPKPAE
jgi:3-hydroxyisobutyrate dehydrogenase-like beta-hydroxyacid dehydrogenase